MRFSLKIFRKMLIYINSVIKQVENSVVLILNFIPDLKDFLGRDRYNKKASENSETFIL